MVTVIQKDVVAVLIICLALIPADVEIIVKTKNSCWMSEAVMIMTMIRMI